VELREVFAAEVLPRLDPTDRTGRQGGTGVPGPGPRAALVSSGLPRAAGVVRLQIKDFYLSGAAGLGQDERVPVGREDVQARRRGRVAGGVAMGAGTRLPVGCGYEHLRRKGRVPGGVAVGAGARRPVGRGDV